MANPTLPKTGAPPEADPERIVWTLGCGLWTIVLLGALGYVLHGTTVAFMGGLLGLLLAYHFHRQGRFEWIGRALGAPPFSSRSDTVDWKRLLDHEKFHFARQLEREGREERAQAIYQHLIHHEFPSIAPYKRLAAIYRHQGAYCAERDILKQALSHLHATSENASPINSSSTHRELMQRYKQAHERCTNESLRNRHHEPK